MQPSTPRAAEPVQTLYLCEAEAWLLDEVVRHTFGDDGQPVGRDLLLKAFSVLREFRAAASRPFPPKELPLAVTEAECWVIDYFVNAARLQRVDPQTARAARELLLKVFDLILTFQTERLLGGERLSTAHGDDALDATQRERLAEWHRAQRGHDGRADEPR